MRWRNALSKWIYCIQHGIKKMLQVAKPLNAGGGGIAVGWRIGLSWQGKGTKAQDPRPRRQPGGGGDPSVLDANYPRN